MFQDMTIEQLLEEYKRGGLTLIDVRSPSEFAEATVPGSLNIPLFDDEERRQVGTLYKQVSIPAAKERGLEIVSAKLPAFIKQFSQLEGRKAVFCWRGGMRSKTTATVLSLMGIRVYRLTGGFRAYRKWVVEELERFAFKPHCYVVSGYTGSGKTKLLQRLAERGYPVLDLETMAQHRGSIFGQIGLKPNNQKTFESLLVHKLLEVNDSPFVLLEAESKRVGKAVLPGFLVEGKERGTPLFIRMPAAERVRNIMEEYRPEEHKDACLDAFHQIKRRIHTPIAAEMEAHLIADRFPEAIALLLEHYYDPRYEHAATQYGSERVYIDAGNVDEAVEAIVRMLPAVKPENAAAMR
ncbi:tRNA 2-selenouridine(34) synthase MnmH [Paenibacillus sp. MBLB4367]|uniref:tRNA 2-selenouridine(34) synthase MnmH n=1 Tax=Paenibacillus sp. MBLB4367 TaxID=3384767 RepID=UPI0039082F47